MKNTKKSPNLLPTIVWLACPAWLASPLAAKAQVVSFDCGQWPETVGWSRDDDNTWAPRRLDAGWLVHETPAISDPELTQFDYYRQSLAAFAGTPAFFVEWRLQTTGLREGIPSGSPAILTASGLIGIGYHFTVARDQVRFIDPYLSSVRFDVQPGVPHVYRLEVRGKAWTFAIDDGIVNSGVAAKNYPTSDSVVVFGVSSYLQAITTRWDYIRYGVIPDDAGAGDLNCDGTINQFDIDPFIAALVSADGYGQQHPACNILLADVNTDGSVNQFDIIPFVDLLMP